MKKRIINYIVVHCGQPKMDTTKKALRAAYMHQGFHYHVSTDADVAKLMLEIRNSALGLTAKEKCLCISVEGCPGKNGYAKQSPSMLQEEALFDLVVQLTERYPEAKVVGMEDFDGAEPPDQAFNVKHWLANYVPMLEMAA